MGGLTLGRATFLCGQRCGFDDLRLEKRIGGIRAAQPVAWKYLSRRFRPNSTRKMFVEMPMYPAGGAWTSAFFRGVCRGITHKALQ
jgi:hypothetical protein